MTRWITDTLGTSAWDGAQGESDVQLLDVREFVDKGGNDSSKIHAAILDGVNYLREGRRLIVCCDYGISRSNAIAAGILAVYDEMNFSAAVRRVMAATGEQSIKLPILASVRKALAQTADEENHGDGHPRSLLVTGGSGFIGTAFLHRLDPAFRVVAPARHDIDVMQDPVALDLLVKEKQVDTLVHLATPRVYTNNSAMGPTLTMLKNVLDVCYHNSVKLVFLSSWMIYAGYKTQLLEVDEVVEPRPGDTYGETKTLCEKLIQLYNERQPLQHVILRSSSVYGPGGHQPKFIYNFLDHARHNRDITIHRYRNGPPTADIMHINDLCRAIVAAVDHECEGVFNVGAGVGTPIAAIGKYLIDHVKSSSTIRYMDVSAYASNIVMNSMRAQRVLHWQPKEDLWSGLANLAAEVEQRNPGE